MLPLGNFLKDWNWTTVAQRAAELAGEPVPVEVTTDERALSENEEREALRQLQEKVSDLNRREEPGLREEAKVRIEATRILSPSQHFPTSCVSRVGDDSNI
jgi:hypothetical protein